MLVQIQDRPALTSLSLVTLRAYLETHGWRNIGPWGSRPAVVYVTEQHGRDWEIIVPNRDTLAGYAENMAESIAILAAVEERSQIDIFYDLSAAGADVIRMRSSNGMTKEPLSLRQSAAMLNDAFSMVAAAARAVEKPQATYRGPLSSDVVEYLDNVRPLPGHQGYELTLHSPVSPELNTQEDMGDDFYAPFSRRASLKLADALAHSRDAISGAIRADPAEHFRQAVFHGVSANLCDALANLAKKGEGIEIDLFWAPIRPSPVRDNRFQFSQHSADILTEAAKSFRQNEPSFDEQITAHVVHLDRGPDEFDGRALLLATRDERLVRIKVEFDRSLYDLAIEVHREQKTITVDGDVHRVGNTYELRNPRNVHVIPQS
jgi:hypothetical protein